MPYLSRTTVAEVRLRTFWMRFTPKWSPSKCAWPVPRSPADYSSPPSFGLASSDEEDGNTPLHPRVTRMTCRGPWSPRASGSVSKPTRQSSASVGSATKSPDGRNESRVEEKSERSVEKDNEQTVRRNIETSFQRNREEDQSPERGVDEEKQKQRTSTPRQGSTPTHLSERVQAAVQQQQADEEERRRKSAEQRANLDRMVAAQREMRSIVSQVFTSIK
ncbi:hypothetical protein FJT64_014295 [Amphibalanus amphitrite]|uniref:Uncharacterized protein n=1 Tax=Amphibalanus amphitrite TaxID=1232801 RepID=A0A6A4UX90_AMPAM|nr:hypothetical protein FJT64_014295 [Amphibalanus amphitrite]